MTAWLLTWLWQGSAIALGVAIASRYAPRRNAATRHLIWSAALLAVAYLGWRSTPQFSTPATAAAAAGPIYVPSAPDFLLSVFVGIWTAVALVGLLRLLPALRGVYAARDRCSRFPAAIECRLPLWLQARESGRCAELMLCDAVPGATVLGFLRPWIAIPPSLLETLPIDELDQVILHEYAHVQRRDDWSRLVQAAIVSAVWIHPAALFVSRALSREREMACDEWVIARTGKPKAYARCLAHAAEARMQLRSAGRDLVPALLGTRSDLLRRVDRVLDMRGRASRRVSPGALASAVSVMAVASVYMQGVQLAEIAEIVFPTGHVQQVEPTSFPGPGSQQYEFTVDALFAAPVVASTPLAPAASDISFAPLAPAEPVVQTLPAVAGSNAPLANSRAISGVYAVPEAAAVAHSGEPARWNAITEPSRDIASAATKTGKRIAAGVTRAGVSLARSF